MHFYLDLVFVHCTVCLQWSALSFSSAPSCTSSSSTPVNNNNNNNNNNSSIVAIIVRASSNVQPQKSSDYISEKNIRAGLGTAAKYKDDNILNAIHLIFDLDHTDNGSNSNNFKNDDNNETFCPGTRNPVCQAHSRMGPRRKEVTLNRRVEDTSGRAGKEVTSDRRGKEVTSMGQRILGKRRQEEVAKASFLLTCGCFQRWKQQQQQGEWSGSKRGATDEQCRRWQQPGVGVETQVHFSLLEQPQM